MARALHWDHLELTRRLGEGKAGVVWQAKLSRDFRDLSAGSMVAVKLYKNWLLEEAGQLERILRELEIGRSVTHCNLVRTLTLLQKPGAGPALVMKYYEGQTLEALLSDRAFTTPTSRSLEWFLSLLGPLAGALAALHEAGAVHRDVKPRNIILTEEGPVLMDLGVIKSDQFPEQTTTGEFLGTIRYAAPEYLFGRGNSPLIDIYSLGAIAYEMFSGKRFLEEYEHWADLVHIKKGHWFPARVDWRAVAAQSTVNAAEFARLLCEAALAEPENRNLNLKLLERSIQRRLWMKPFHVANGEFVAGPGQYPFPAECNIPEYCRREIHPSRLRSPQDVAETLRITLDGEAMEFLRELLENHSWDESWGSGLYLKGSRIVTGSRMARLLATHAVSWDGSWDHPEYHFPEVVRKAYLLGLL